MSTAAAETDARLEEAPEVVLLEPEVQDLPKLCRLVREWHEGTGLNLPPIEEGRVLRWLLNLQESPDGFLAYAELQGGRYSKVLAGVVGVALTAPMWSSQPMAYSHIFHVTAAHRRWGVAEDLVTAAKGWAAQRRCPLVLDLVQGKKIGAAPARYYQLEGATLVGGVLMYGLSVDELEE